MPHFDADAWLRAQEKPTITIDGQTHTGRLLSYQEFLPFGERIDRMRKGESEETLVDFAGDYIRQVFPDKKYITWKPSIANRILSLPNLVEVLTCFLEQQTAAMKTPSTQPSNQTNGI